MGTLVRLVLALSLALPAQTLRLFVTGLGGGSTMAFGASVRLASFAATNSMNATGPTVTGSNTVGFCATVVDNSVSVTGVTWGATSMTAVPSGAITDGSFKIQTWSVANPGSAATITVTAGANWSAGAFANCSYFQNANTSTMIDTATSAQTASACSTYNNALTTGNPNEFVTDVEFIQVSNTAAPQSPSVTDQQGSNGVWGFGSSHQGLISSAGSVTLNYANSGSPSNCAWVGVALHQ